MWRPACHWRCQQRYKTPRQWPPYQQLATYRFFSIIGDAAAVLTMTSPSVMPCVPCGYFAKNSHLRSFVVASAIVVG
ncbi:hypothetical protein TKWG_16495 [Advenella kashmirensis WT001]|uniref:Uncharacterized protein n=1 Tax=Advenella kashmirensis (strain DSM 17095 / LMG 22695 / WT001) TaxID=1036672 RepID=I3UE08_ADVKW|nr:hypothetical protein TKWG_16495 [Advenella kashmirensis WT001]